MIYDSETIKLSRIDNYIYHQYFKLPSEENWEGGFRAGMAYYQSTPEVHHWLNDLSECWGAEQKNIIWLNDNLNKRIRPNKGLMKVAFVRPPWEFKAANEAIDFYMAFSNLCFKHENKSILIETFPTIEKAKKWLA